MFIAPDIQIDERAIELRFVRASGPGGQNVNKVATACELRFDIARSGLFDAGLLWRLAELAGRRMTQEGVIVLRADRFRTQEQNRADARARLAALIEAARRPPKPRVATRTPPREKKARLEGKRRRSAVKAQRRAGDED